MALQIVCSPALEALHDTCSKLTHTLATALVLMTCTFLNDVRDLPACICVIFPVDVALV